MSDLDVITRFYMGDRALCKFLGFSPNSCIFESNDWWESCHNHIQWLFPLREPSAFNPDAPLVTDEVVNDFANYDTLRHQLRQFKERFEVFLRETIDNWMKPNDHNLLRITRVIKCLKMLLGTAEAYDFYIMVMRLVHTNQCTNPNILISDETRGYWEEAIYGYKVEENVS